MPSKGNYGINEFLNYLSTYYSWISESIQKSITNEYNGTCSISIQHALTIGEVPQLSSRHILRDKHVNNTIAYYYKQYIIITIIYILYYF